MTEQYPRAEVDGFELGMFVSYDDCGDAWVKAPDGIVAGLIWETGAPAYFKISIEPNDARWGTYAVQLPLPLTTDDEAARPRMGTQLGTATVNSGHWSGPDVDRGYDHVTAARPTGPSQADNRRTRCVPIVYPRGRTPPARDG